MVCKQAISGGGRKGAPSRATHLNMSFARAAGTSRGCRGVPLRWLKQDCKYPMGFRGKESGTELSITSLPLLTLSRSFFCTETSSYQVVQSSCIVLPGNRACLAFQMQGHIMLSTRLHLCSNSTYPLCGSLLGLRIK